MRHERNTCYASATRVLHEQHECDTGATRTTRVTNFDFHNETSENIFSHPKLAIWNERLQGEEQYHSKNYLSEMPRSHPKMYLKRAPQKLCGGFI